MNPPEPRTPLSWEAVLALVTELERENAELRRQVADLTACHEALRAEIDQLKRRGKRQAAPCSKGTRKSAPKRPGRKPGAGTFHYREAPPREAITEPPVDVKVILDACPACGGPLEEERVDFAYRTELPPCPRPQVTQSRV